MMTRGSILFLRTVIVLFGAAVLAGMLYEPWIEGVNANADFAGVYFDDPFLAYAYLGSVPFFFGLTQGFRLLGYVGSGEALSPDAVQSVRLIKYCAIAVVGFIAGAVAYIVLAAQDEDGAGAVMLGVIASFIGVVTATAAAVLERVLRNAVDLKSEHDLTV